MQVLAYETTSGALKIKCAMTLPKLTSELSHATETDYGTVQLNSGASPADAADPTSALTAEALCNLLDPANTNDLTDAIDQLISRKVTCEFLKNLDMSCVTACP